MSATLYDTEPLWERVRESAGNPLDVRYMGTYATYLYVCPKCGRKEVEFPPDYPYCGPPSAETCRHCASVMRLLSTKPVQGYNRLEGTANISHIRSST